MFLHPTQPSANHTYHNAFWLHKSGWEHCAKVQNTQNGPLITQTKHFAAKIPNARGISKKHKPAADFTNLFSDSLKLLMLRFVSMFIKFTLVLLVDHDSVTSSFAFRKVLFPQRPKRYAIVDDKCIWCSTNQHVRI